MKLAELDAMFLKYELRSDGVYWVPVDTIEEAQGVSLLCPKCFVANGGRVGTHRIACWSRSRGVPDDARPKPGRWTLEGVGLQDLTLNGDGGSRSIQLTGGGCAWHGYVTNGETSDA